MPTFSLSNSRYAFDIGYDAESNTDFNLGYAVEETEFRAFNRFRINDPHRLTFGLAGKLYNVRPGTLEPEGSESDVVGQDLPKNRE